MLFHGVAWQIYQALIKLGMGSEEVKSLGQVMKGYRHKVQEGQFADSCLSC